MAILIVSNVYISYVQERPVLHSMVWDAGPPSLKTCISIDAVDSPRCLYISTVTNYQLQLGIILMGDLRSGKVGP